MDNLNMAIVIISILSSIVCVYGVMKANRTIRSEAEIKNNRNNNSIEDANEVNEQHLAREKIVGCLRSLQGLKTKIDNSFLDNTAMNDDIGVLKADLNYKIGVSESIAVGDLAYARESISIALNLVEYLIANCCRLECLQNEKNALLTVRRTLSGIMGSIDGIGSGSENVDSIFNEPQQSRQSILSYVSNKQEAAQENIQKGIINGVC